jgi:hypothetical protein
VAALAVYVPAEDWGDGGIVNWLRDEMKSHPEYIPGFLELLTVLPEVHINHACSEFIFVIYSEFFRKKKDGNVIYLRIK